MQREGVNQLNDSPDVLQERVARLTIGLSGSKEMLRESFPRGAAAYRTKSVGWASQEGRRRILGPARGEQEPLLDVWRLRARVRGAIRVAVS